MIEFGIDTLKDYAREIPEVCREATHGINRMNVEKITASEASMIKLRDIMMSILKDMKEAYDSTPSDTDISQLTEMMSVMFEQAEEIRKERPVTAEDMSNIVVNYLAQTGLDEKAQKIVKKLCLQMFKGTE